MCIGTCVSLLQMHITTVYVILFVKYETSWIIAIYYTAVDRVYTPEAIFLKLYTIKYLFKLYVKYTHTFAQLLLCIWINLHNERMKTISSKMPKVI